MNEQISPALISCLNAKLCSVYWICPGTDIWGRACLNPHFCSIFNFHNLVQQHHHQSANQYFYVSLSVFLLSFSSYPPLPTYTLPGTLLFSSRTSSKSCIHLGAISTITHSLFPSCLSRTIANSFIPAPLMLPFFDVECALKA